MKKLLLILMLGIAQYANAQHYFNVRTPLHSFATTISSVEPENGLYYCTSDAWDSVNILPNDSSMAYTIFGINFSIFDSIGNVIRDTIYQLPGLRNLDAWNNSLYPMPDKGFLLAASDDVDTSGTFYCMLIRYDSIGDVLWTKEYDKPFCTDTVNNPLWVIVDMKPTGTGEWLVLSNVSCAYSGSYGPTNKESFALTKLDSSFNIEWNKEYSDPSLNALPYRLLVTPAGYLMAGGVENQLYIDQPGTIINRAEMIMTDTTGNQQWIWQSNVNAPGIYTIEDIVQTYDGGYVYCTQGDGYEISEGGGDSEMIFKGWIEKLDANRNPVWNHILSTGWSYIDGNNNQTVLKQLPDSSIVLAGEVVGGFNGEGDTMHAYGSLSKFKADGSVVWEHKYSYPNDTLSYFIYDMKQTPDGGFVMAGQATGDVAPYIYPSQQGWLLKVDSNGCAGPDDPQCWPTITPQPPKGGAIMVYPNPAMDEVTITSPGLPIAIGTGGGEVKLLDMVGRVMIQQALVNGQATISVNGLAPGVYLYEITNGEMVIRKGKFVKE